MNWKTLRKGGTLLGVTYSTTFSNNLWGYNTRVRIVPDNAIEICIDLGPNLRSHTRDNSYIDAYDLASGEIAELKTLKFSDDYIVNQLEKIFEHLEEAPSKWILTLELKGSYSFVVIPELDQATSTLAFTVLEVQ